MHTYTFKVALLDNKRTYHMIKMKGEHNLEDLHKRIFNAFNWDDETHLYSFYLPEKPTKSKRIIRDSPEYADPRVFKGVEVVDINDDNIECLFESLALFKLLSKRCIHQPPVRKPGERVTGSLVS